MMDIKRIILLAGVMVALCASAVVVTILVLYRAELDSTRERLLVTARSQARLIEAISRFDAQWSTEYPEGAKGATLSQIKDAHDRYLGFGKTGEFTLARLEDDRIVFLLRHRADSVGTPPSVPIRSSRAEPMRLALAGSSGSLIGEDYRGEIVVAGYEPVAGLPWGIVVKIDLREIRAPFVRSSLFSIGIMMLLIVIGVAVFWKTSRPLIRKRLLGEARLQHQQKLESIGILASGIAHEINNPISGVLNYAQLISDRLEAGSPLREFSDGIIQETERVSAIVSNLLTFAQYDTQQHSPARIVDIINGTVSLIGTVLKRDQITLNVDVPDDLPGIKCRSQQIQQVLLNLLTNARDALNARYPDYDADKIINLTVHSIEKDSRQWLRITVEDHGIGIPDSIRDRLYDPFFTTKQETGGTGLGLSISHGIVQDHHGLMIFESQPGQHTRFHVEIPVDNGWSMTDSPEG